MDAQFVAWSLLLLPVSALTVFLTLVASAGAISILTGMLGPLPIRTGADHAGLRGSVTKWWRIQRIQWIRSRRKAIISVSKGASLAAGLIFASLSVGAGATIIVRVPYEIARSLTDKPPNPAQGVPAVILLGAILGVRSFIRGSSYASHPDWGRFKLLPKIVLEPQQVCWTRRVELARRVYLYKQLHAAVDISLVLAVLMVFAGLSDATTFEPNQPVTPIQGYDWLLIASIVLTLGLRPVFKGLINGLHPTMRAVAALYECLVPTPVRETDRQVEILDPLGQRRTDLSFAASSLMAAGRRIDSGAPLHPIASLLRGSAVYLRRFLASPDSLVSSFPPMVTDVIRQVIVVIAGPRDYGTYPHLAQSVSAFGVDGVPDAELRSRTTGRWMGLVERMAHLLEMYAKVFAALWALFTLAVVIALLATGRLHLTDMQLK
jgi:hypothetical protein